MRTNLRILDETTLPAEQAKPVMRGRLVKRAAILALVAGTIFLLVWSGGAERRAIQDMSAVERRALFERTLQNLRMVCSPPVDAMRDYCTEQARLALEFQECDRDCEALAFRQISRVQMPR
jgi:hypothetical protein